MRASRVFKDAADLLLIAIGLVCSGAPIALTQNTQTVDTRIGKLDF